MGTRWRVESGKLAAKIGSYDLRSIARSLRPNLVRGSGRAAASKTLVATFRRLGRFRLTLFFAVTATVSLVVAALVVNHVIGTEAQENLIRIAEENTTREAEHIQSMILTGQHPASSMASSKDADLGSAMQDMGPPQALTLGLLIGPSGLANNFSALVEGLNVVKVNLLDLEGGLVWSTDPKATGLTEGEGPKYRKAMSGEVSSELARARKVTHLDGTSRSIDVVETYLPLRDPTSHQIIGVMEIYRDVTPDVGMQIDDAKSAVLSTIVATMGGLFLVLLGFVAAADLTISRSNFRALALVEGANQKLEDRVRERTLELESANEQLVDAQDRVVRSERLAAIGQLAGGVAHDLRNPLGAIKNAVYYLRKKLDSSDLAHSNPRIGQFLDIVDDEIEHSDQIMSDLLTFARVDALSLQPTNLENVIESSLSGIEINVCISVVQRYDPEIPEVQGDYAQLQRVFTNLAGNAQDAMPDGGELVISMQRVGGFVEVALSDTGIGIGDEDLKRVLDPLFTTKAKGTGLGLAICEEIVSNHGGTIDVKSVPGEGATFTVRLPLEGDSSNEVAG